MKTGLSEWKVVAKVKKKGHNFFFLLLVYNRSVAECSEDLLGSAHRDVGSSTASL